MLFAQICFVTVQDQRERRLFRRAAGRGAATQPAQAARQRTATGPPVAARWDNGAGGTSLALGLSWPLRPGDRSRSVGVVAAAEPPRRSVRPGRCDRGTGRGPLGWWRRRNIPGARFGLAAATGGPVAVRWESGGGGTSPARGSAWPLRPGDRSRSAGVAARTLGPQLKPGPSSRGSANRRQTERGHGGIQAGCGCLASVCRDFPFRFERDGAMSNTQQGC